MPPKQGSKSSSGGRLDGSNGTAVAAANFVLGAGWGSAATHTVTAGSTDVRGQIVITASTTTPAQATSTVTMTFTDGAYAAAPFPIVQLATSTQAVADAQPTAVVATTTTLVWKSGVLPVDTKVYTYNYALIA